MTLPPLAHAVFHPGGLVRASSRGDAVLLRRDGVGVAAVVDARGRVRLPSWMRHRVGTGGAVHLAARRPDGSTVVVAPVTCLDVIADAFAGEVA